MDNEDAIVPAAPVAGFANAGAGAAPGGSEAAAILLMMLGDSEAAEILSYLEPHEVQHLGSAMFNVADVSEDEVESVFNTFMTRNKALTTIGFGAAPRIRAVMEHALGADRAENVLARITPPTRSRALDPLRWMDAKTIAALIEPEHPQIAEVGRMTQSPAATRGGASEAAKIMNNMRPGSDQRIIRSLAKADKQLAQRIEDEMFIFDDLGEMDEKNIGILLRNIENDVLIVALKGCDEKLREKMLGCMSARAADSIRDEMAERGPLRLAEVHEAQKEVLAIARRLADAGTLMLAGRGDDYV
jgi:flagellar motor switch protein FliG